MVPVTEQVVHDHKNVVGFLHILFPGWLSSQMQNQWTWETYVPKDSLVLAFARLCS